MNCDEVRELLAAYVLDALDANERRAVSRHLERCPDCTALAAALATSAHELPLVLDTADAPELPAEILARLERLTAASRRSRLRPRLPRRIRLPLAAAAMVALAIVAVLAAVRSQQAVADQQDLRARLVALVGEQSVIFDVVDSPRTNKILLLPPHEGSRAYGKVYTRTDLNVAVAFVNRLAQANGGARYLLWIRSDHTTTLAGVLTLHSGFGYLVFHHDARSRVRDAFVTHQKPSSTPSGAIVLELDRQGRPHRLRTLMQHLSLRKG